MNLYREEERTPLTQKVRGYPHVNSEYDTSPLSFTDKEHRPKLLSRGLFLRKPATSIFYLETQKGDLQKTPNKPG